MNCSPFWTWFVRPFAELAAGLTMALAFAAVCAAFVLVVVVWDRFSRWRRRNAR